MITKTELLKKLDDPDNGIEELILWADSLPDDAPQAGFVSAYDLENALADEEGRQLWGDAIGDVDAYANGWIHAMQWARHWVRENSVPLTQNDAGSNEPGFGPKTTQDLSQKQTQPEPSVAEIALRLYTAHPEKYRSVTVAVDVAFEMLEAIHAKVNP
jgi:hypothetical protein